MTGISISKNFAKKCEQLQSFIGNIIEQKKNRVEKPENSRLDIVDTMIQAGFAKDEVKWILIIKYINIFIFVPDFFFFC